MAYQRKVKKKEDNTAKYIIIGLGATVVIVLVLALILPLRGCEPGAGTTPTSSATVLVTPMSTPSVDIVYTAPPNTEQTGETTLPTVSDTASPNPDLQGPLEVPSDKIFAVHLTVDSGFFAEAEPVFDDAYSILSEDETDYNDVRMMIFLTDYKGNSRVYRFDNTNVTIKLRDFLLADGGTASGIDNLSTLSILVDKAHNVHLTWAGKTIKIDEAASLGGGISAQHQGVTILSTVKSLDLLDKIDYQR